MDTHARRFYGIYPGVVWDVSDPETRGRLRLKVPMVTGDSVTGWAEPCRDPGSSAVPAIGSVAWVMFIAGDADHPVWLGTP